METSGCCGTPIIGVPGSGLSKVMDWVASKLGLPTSQEDTKLFDSKTSGREKFNISVKIINALASLLTAGEGREGNGGFKETIVDPGVTKEESPNTAEPYNRQTHYGKTPKQSDRKALGADKNHVVDHDPSLVKRYYEGDPKIGEKAGKDMTPEERRASANDRSRMKLQSNKESQQQGAEMSRYSKAKKKEHEK